MTNKTSTEPQIGLQRSIDLMRLLGDRADAIWPLLEPEDADRLRGAMDNTPSTISAPAVNASSFWHNLSAADLRAISKVLEQESPQITAITLSRLLPDQAALLVNSIPERRAAAALYRLANIGVVQDAVIQALERAFAAHLETGSAAQIGAQTEIVAEILDGVGGEREQRLLAALEHRETGLRDRITRHMFRFEDLVQLNAASVQTLLSHLDRSTLIAAMHGAPKPVAARLFQNMTRRAADLLRAEIETSAPTSSESEAAQRDVVRMVRRLLKQKEISMERYAQQDRAA